MGNKGTKKELLATVKNMELLLTELVVQAKGGTYAEAELPPEHDVYAYKSMSIGERGQIAYQDVDPLEVLCTVREAYLLLRVSRGTIDNLREKGWLTTVKHVTGIRLVNREVDELLSIYSIPKGKV